MQSAHVKADRFLVIDDNLNESILLGEELRRVRPHARIVTAKTAEEGLLRVRKEAYDLVLCNFRLPGISGLAFMKLSLELQPNTPVIILTTQSTEESAQDLFKGACGFLRKPVQADVLDRMITSALAGSPGIRPD